MDVTYTLLSIPESGIPESFKVLLKELQSLGLDMRVQREENGVVTDVDIMESVDYCDTDLRSVIEGDRKYNHREQFAAHGYSQQEYVGEELVDVAENEPLEEPDMMEDAFDDIDDV